MTVNMQMRCGRAPGAFIAALFAGFVAFGSLDPAAGGFLATAAAQMSDKADETVLHKGVWRKKFARSAGEWSIVERGGKRFVVLSDDFKTRGAPDLKIFLSPTSAADATGDNATSGSLLVAELAARRGGQTYELPAGADLGAYRSILIHCEAYSKLWSAADL